MTEIGRGAFENCKSLTSITLPESVTEIGDCAFDECTSLKSITLPVGVTEIGESAFSKCTSLTSITLPDGVTKIGEFAFRSCESLSYINIPDGVTKIAVNVFSDCVSLERVIFSESLESIGDGYNNPFKGTIFGTVWFFVTHSKSGFKTQQLIEKNSQKFADCLVLFLKDNGKHPLVKPNTFVKTAEYVLEQSEQFTLEDIQELAEIAKTRESKKAVTLFDSFIKAQTAPEEKQDERFAPLYKLFKVSELTTRFVKYEKDIDYTQVKLKDTGETAPVFVTKAALADYLAMFDEYKGGFGGDVLTVYYCPNSDKAAEYLDADSLAKAVESAYQKRVNTDPAWIIPYCRYGTSAMIAEIVSQIPKWDRWATGGSQGRRRAKIAVPSVKLSKTKEAMMYYEKKNELDVYARFHNTTADILRDTVLADFGIDDEGKVIYDLGNKTITAALQDDLTFSLYDNDAQKTVKSIPKKGADPDLHAKASDDFKKLKSDVKKVVKARNDLLFDCFLSGRTRPANEWLSVYPTNPVLRKVAELIVWNQGKDTFLLTKDGAVDCNGQPYTINENRSIGVTHTIEMDAETLSAWRDYFAEKKIKQPFEQVWEAAVDSYSIKEDRYKGCPLPFYYFRNRAKHGITIEDEDFHNVITINFKECSTYVERLDWEHHYIDNEHRFEVEDFTFNEYTRQVNHIVYLLDKWTIRQCILKDDPTIGTLLDSFTLPQIMSFIDLPTKNECVNTTAVLLNYRNEHYPEYDGFAALDDLLLDDDF